MNLAQLRWCTMSVVQPISTQNYGCWIEPLAAVTSAYIIDVCLVAHVVACTTSRSKRSFNLLRSLACWACRIWAGIYIVQCRRVDDFGISIIRTCYNYLTWERAASASRFRWLKRKIQANYGNDNDQQDQGDCDCCWHRGYLQKDFSYALCLPLEPRPAF